MRLDSGYADCFTKYLSYFGRALRLLKYMYEMTNSENLFDDELIEWFIKVGFIQYQYQMYIYYKYAPVRTNIVVLSYVDYCVNWYTSEALVKWCVENLRNRFIVNFLGYANWFMLIRIPLMKEHSISV